MKAENPIILFFLYRDPIILNVRVGKPIGGHLAWSSTETVFSPRVFPEVVVKKSLYSKI